MTAMPRDVAVKPPASLYPQVIDGEAVETGIRPIGADLATRRLLRLIGLLFLLSAVFLTWCAATGYRP